MHVLRNLRSLIMKIVKNSISLRINILQVTLVLWKIEGIKNLPDWSINYDFNKYFSSLEK